MLMVPGLLHLCLLIHALHCTTCIFIVVNVQTPPTKPNNGNISVRTCTMCCTSPRTLNLPPRPKRAPMHLNWWESVVLAHILIEPVPSEIIAWLFWMRLHTASQNAMRKLTVTSCSVNLHFLQKMSGDLVVSTAFSLSHLLSCYMFSLHQPRRPWLSCTYIGVEPSLFNPRPGPACG